MAENKKRIVYEKIGTMMVRFEIGDAITTDKANTRIQKNKKKNFHLSK